MVSIQAKRSIMLCFSDKTSIDGHRVRFVLAEKGIQHEVELIDPDNPPEDLVAINPYYALPTLIDRDLVLYDPQVIIEYLDERFPHPPLMPVDPISRAKARLAIQRILIDTYSYLPDLADGSDRKASRAKKGLRDSLIASTELFAYKPYFMSDDFSVMDATMAPLLWRLPYFGIELPAQSKVIEEYGERIFSRAGFQESLTEEEREMRD